MAFILPVSHYPDHYTMQVISADLFLIRKWEKCLESPVKLIRFIFMRFKDEKLTQWRKSQSTFPNQ